MNARFLVAALFAVSLLVAAGTVLRSVDSHASVTAATAQPVELPALSRREHLARLVAETAARAAAETARGKPSMRAVRTPPDMTRLARSDAP